MKIDKIIIGVFTGVSAIGTTVTTAVSSTIGRNWLSVGICGGCGFGLIQGAISYLAFQKIPKNILASEKKLLVTEFVGGAATYGLSYAAAAIGFIAAPITLPTALVLTVASMAFKCLCIVVGTGLSNANKLPNKEKTSNATPIYDVPSTRDIPPPLQV